VRLFAVATLILVAIFGTSCTDHPVAAEHDQTTLTTQTTEASSSTTAATYKMTVTVHVPDSNGPKPPPRVAPSTPCTIGPSDDTATIYGDGHAVIASANMPAGILLFPGNTGFTTPYQCFSETTVTVPYQSAYTVIMPDHYSSAKYSFFYLEHDNWIAPVDDSIGVCSIAGIPGCPTTGG
jgi:hypothetical protein